MMYVQILDLHLIRPSSDFFQLFADTWKNNERPVPTLNKFCKVYINGFDGAKELHEHLMAAKSTDELLFILKKAI